MVAWLVGWCSLNSKIFTNCHETQYVSSHILDVCKMVLLFCLQSADFCSRVFQGISFSHSFSVCTLLQQVVFCFWRGDPVKQGVCEVLSWDSCHLFTAGHETGLHWSQTKVSTVTADCWTVSRYEGFLYPKGRPLESVTLKMCWWYVLAYSCKAKHTNQN